MNYRRVMGLLCLMGVMLPSALLAQGSVMGDAAARELPMWWYFAPLASVLALVTAWLFYRSIMGYNPGTPRMQEIASYVRVGAYAYLRQQYRVVGIFFIVVSLLLAFMAFVLKVQHPLVPFAFLTGGFFSGLSGFFGMKTATAASSRTAQAASESLDRGLRVAFRAGAVMGLTVVGLALFDVSAWFLYLYHFHHQIFGGEPMAMETITVVMLCFGMGASTQALFARVGGGIYTKAADVGADLVGKVEAGIPEDDPRNPAVIADNVGDNVGDVAGMGADLYESYAGSILASAALGVAAATGMGYDLHVVFAYLTAPMLLAAVGIAFSILGMFAVRAREGASIAELLSSLNRGIYLAGILTLIASFFVLKAMGLPVSTFYAVVIGLVLGIVIGKGTEWATAADFGPTRHIAEQARTGPATVIIAGIAQGMLSTWIPILATSVGMLTAFLVCDGTANIMMGLYGIGIAAVGMLSTLGITLATDAYGPIADNAGGLAEMTEMPPEVRRRTDALDSLGNTTAAIGKGFAIGSAALTALALLASYVEEVRVGLHREAASHYEAPAVSQPYAVVASGYGKYAIYLPGAAANHADQEQFTISAFAAKTDDSVEVVAKGLDGQPETVSLVVNDIGAKARAASGVLRNSEGEPFTVKKATLDDYMAFYKVNLMNPKVLVGLFMGMLMVFLFSALTMLAVGRAASAMVEEVRRQFREHPGIMAGTETPDYARCVSISTVGAQREMILPSVLGLTIPIVVGLLLNVAGVLGLLAGTLCGGFAMAVFMANSGGAWDNAKKYVEAGNLGGKGSDCHKATVVGDTVGDPFKDTSGPSLNILIKLASMVSIVFAGLIVKFAPIIGVWLGMG